MCVSLMLLHRKRKISPSSNGGSYFVVRVTNKWRTAKWKCQISDTPKVIDTKFDQGNCVGNNTYCAKIQSDHHIGGFVANKENRANVTFA